VVGEGGGAIFFVPLRQPHCHGVDRAHGIVDQQRQRDDEGAKRYALQIDADILHHRKDHRERQWNRECHDCAGSEPETDDAHRHDDRDRLPERFHKLADGAVHDGRLIRHDGWLDTDRQIGDNFAHSLTYILAKRQNVAAVAHRDCEADTWNSVNAENRLWRVDKNAPDVGNVAQAQQAAIRSNVDRGKVLLGIEGAGNPEPQRFIACFQSAGRTNGVLSFDRRDQGGAIYAESCEFLSRKLDNDLFILGAQDLDLGDVGHAQQPRPDFLDIVAQLAMREAVGREAVDDAEGVAELVVEAGADDARRQGVADVAHALSNVIPNIRHVPGGRAAFQIHEYGRRTGAGETAQEVEIGRLFERSFDTVGHLIECVVEGGTRPGRLNDHRPEGERRIFIAAETKIRHQTRGDRDEHAIHHEGAMLERPFGKIELRH